MPELSTDAFGDAMGRGFYFTDYPVDSYVEDHHSNFYQQSIFAGSAFSPIFENKASHQDSGQKILPWMSTQPPLPEPEDFFPTSTSFLPLASSACQQQIQQTVDGSSPYCLTDSQHPDREESADIWMRDIFDDSPSITSIPELPPWTVSTPTNASLDTIPPLDLSMCPIGLPDSQLLEKAVRCLEEEPLPAESPGNLHRSVKSSRAVSTTNFGPIYGAEVSFQSATPTESRKPWGSRRSRLKGSEKSKKVPNASQVDHVLRERQRRDEMSFKMATLARLVPSATAPSLKRDRTSILDEGCDYVRHLQKTVEELKERFVELKLEKSARGAKPWSEPKVQLGNPGTSSTQPGRLVEFHVQVEDDSQTAASIEKCRCRPDFLSSAMKVLELLNLDVCRCTITKVFDHTICVILAKPRLSTSTPVPTSASVVSAFRSSLQLNITKKDGYDPPLQRRPANAGASLGPRQREPGEEEDLCRYRDLPWLCLKADCKHAKAPHPRLIPSTSIAQ